MLAKLDARVGATACSTRISTKCLTVWLRRVTDLWETQRVRSRERDPRSLTACCGKMRS